MRKALVTNIEVEKDVWHYAASPEEQGYWEKVLYPVNSILNIIVVDENSDYNPPANTYLVDAVDSMKIGDVYQG